MPEFRRNIFLDLAVGIYLKARIFNIHVVNKNKNRADVTHRHET